MVDIHPSPWWVSPRFRNWYPTAGCAAPLPPPPSPVTANEPRPTSLRWCPIVGTPRMVGKSTKRLALWLLYNWEVVKKQLFGPTAGFMVDIIHIFIYMYIYTRVYIYMVVDQNSFIPERPFFADKNFTFAKLSRTPCLSFAGPMLANGPLMKIRSQPAKLRQRITDHFLVAF